MTDDLEPSPEDIERWTRNLMAGGMPKSGNTPIPTSEQKMIAKVLGTKTAAEHFLRNQSPNLGAPSHAHVHARERRYRPIQVRIRIEYWERDIGAFPEWIIERYENGKLVTEHRGYDWEKRDALLIKLQAAGVTCTPVTVAGKTPEPIRGRKRDQRKAPSGRFAIISQIGKLTTDDLEDYDE